jgi:hypothetical protein
MGKSIDPDIIEKFIRDHEDLARNIKVGIGTWYNTDDGHTYLDFVALIEDRDQAIGLGKKYNQIGIFGLKDFEYIETGGTGEANTDLLSLLDRLREIFNETGN